MNNNKREKRVHHVRCALMHVQLYTSADLPYMYVGAYINFRSKPATTTRQAIELQMREL